MALQLKKAGVGKVHPLEGGFDAWLALDLPIEPISESEDSVLASDLKNVGTAGKV